MTTPNDVIVDLQKMWDGGRCFWNMPRTVVTFCVFRYVDRKKTIWKHT